MPFGSLWIPVVVSTVAVFIASSIAWMVLPHHRKDYLRLPDEDGLLAALRKQPVPVGQYMFPHCTHGQEKDPAWKARMEQGPVGTLVVRPAGMPAMGKLLAAWAAHVLLVSFVVAYVARHALTFGAPGVEIMRITGTTAAAAYILALLPESIWMGRPWGGTLRHVADGIAYALLTAVVFCLLWPAAP